VAVSASLGRCAHAGRVRVLRQVSGFERLDARSLRVVELQQLPSLLPLVREAAALWLVPPAGTAALVQARCSGSCGDGDPRAALHAAGHALAAALPLLVQCGGAAELDMEHGGGRGAAAGEGVLTLWETSRAGSGVVAGAFPRLGEWLRLAGDLLEACPCERGCAACCLGGCAADDGELDAKLAAAIVVAALDAAVVAASTSDPLEASRSGSITTTVTPR
jgi:DEAD/DEAH box helicase domain-containing protein